MPRHSRYAASSVNSTPASKTLLPVSAFASPSCSHSSFRTHTAFTDSPERTPAHAQPQQQQGEQRASYKWHWLALLAVGILVALSLPLQIREQAMSMLPRPNLQFMGVTDGTALSLSVPPPSQSTASSPAKPQAKPATGEPNGSDATKAQAKQSAAKSKGSAKPVQAPAKPTNQTQKKWVLNRRPYVTDPDSPEWPNTLALCTMMRNEHPDDVMEWIMYHKCASIVLQPSLHAQTLSGALHTMI